MTFDAFKRWDKFLDDETHQFQTRIPFFMRPVAAEISNRNGQQSANGRVQFALNRIKEFTGNSENC